jgi:acylphosphatase
VFLLQALYHDVRKRSETVGARADDFLRGFAVVRRHLIITGTVQGVGYRDALCEEAERHGVMGWVRNRRDGSVEALLQGMEADVDAMIAWARRGPAAARVIKVSVAAAPAQWDRTYSQFDRWPSA